MGPGKNTGLHKMNPWNSGVRRNGFILKPFGTWTFISYLFWVDWQILKWLASLQMSLWDVACSRGVGHSLKDNVAVRWDCKMVLSGEKSEKKRLSAPKRVVDANLCREKLFEYQAVSRRRYSRDSRGDPWWNYVKLPCLRRPQSPSSSLRPRPRRGMVIPAFPFFRGGINVWLLKK